MTRLRPLVLLAAFVVVAAAISGCVVIKNQTSSQRLQGYVTLRLDLCVADRNQSTYTTCDPADPGMNTVESDTAGDGDEQEGRGQLLVGYRVPNGTTTPTSFQSTDLSLTMTRSAGYTAALNTTYPPPAGFFWQGYVSSEVPFDPADNPLDRTTILTPEFVLPPGANGAPFDGPFLWRGVVGFRQTGTGGVSPASSVACPSPVGTSACFDSPAAARVPIQLQAQVSDIGVLAGSNAVAGAGETATLNFPIQNRAEGALGNRTVQLSATTTVPGATAKTVAASLLVTANQTPPTPVTVEIPPGTPIGSYQATLTATATNGQPAMVRTNKAVITVVDKSAPSIRVSSPGDATYTVGQSVVADYDCTDEPGGSGVASCLGPVAPGSPVDTSTPGTFSFTVTGADVAGNSASVTRNYTVTTPVPAPAPTATPIVQPSASPGRVTVALSFLFSSTGISTKFTSLQVKSVPSGSLVTATCKGKGCPTKKVKGKKQNVVFTKKNASGTVNLTPFRNKALRAGAVLTVTVTKPGSFGMVKKLTVKKNKKPVLSTTCLQPNSSTAKASCVS